LYDRLCSNDKPPMNQTKLPIKTLYQTLPHGILTIDRFYSCTAVVPPFLLARSPPFFRLDLGWWAFELRTPTNSSSKSDTSEASSIRSSSERPLALTGGNFNLAIFYSQPSEFKCLIINCILFMTFRISRSKIMSLVMLP